MPLVILLAVAGFLGWIDAPMCGTVGSVTVDGRCAEVVYGPGVVAHGRRD